MTAMFGPQGPNAVEQKPPGSTQQRYGNRQTWVKDCTAPGAGDGTVLDASFYNRIIGVLDHLLGASGVSALPGDDSALYRAILMMIAGDAPNDLDTLEKLAHAVNNDFNFAQSVAQRFALLKNVAYSGAYSDLTGAPTFGEGAFLDAGAAANQLVQLDGSGRLPAVDGSQLSGVTVSNITYPAQGQCELVLSGGNLLLKPRGGNRLTINGIQAIIPDAGLTLAPSGLTASTLYYIYATQSGGNVATIEASTTGHSTDTATNNKGVEIKTGDSTRTLIGMARTTAATAWADTAGQRFVRSWFNRRAVAQQSTGWAGGSLANGVDTEVSTTFRLEFLIWADEVASFNMIGGVFASVASNTVKLMIGYDGSAMGAPIFAITDATGQTRPLATTDNRSLAEGYHYASIYGQGSSGSGATTFHSASFLSGHIR